MIVVSIFYKIFIQTHGKYFFKYFYKIYPGNLSKINKNLNAIQYNCIKIISMKNIVFALYSIPEILNLNYCAKFTKIKLTNHLGISTNSSLPTFVI